MDLRKENSFFLAGTRCGSILCVVLSFLLPFLILYLGLFTIEIAPFGPHSLAISDGAGYLNNLMQFRRLLTGEESFLYSFENGLGGNEWSILAWGGINPVLLFTLFMKDTESVVFLSWIILTNLSLCGLTMYLLLADVHGHRASNLIFSTSYALMGFSIAYCYHYGFFIGPQMLPLMVLGLRRLFFGRSPVLYILSLGVCIFLNFYFGFMLCVVSLILLIVYLVMHAENRVTVIKTWFASSIIAGFSGAPMWLPALKAYTGGGRIDQAAEASVSFSENMPFLQIFSKLFSGANSNSEQVNGMPFIFCGILVVALVILYFMNRDAGAHQKKLAGVILAFYLLTFYISAFTRFMHGGTHTNWFNYRYSFVFSFFLIMLAEEEFQYLDTITLRDVKRCGGVLLIATILVFSTKYDFLTGGEVVMDLAFLLVMWLFFYLYKTKPEKVTRRVLTGALLAAVCVNLFANFTLSTVKVRSMELDLESFKTNTVLSGGSIDAIRNYDTSFYRMEKDFSESGSSGIDPLKYNYNGVSHSGPAERMFIHIQLNRLGINWYDMRHWYAAGVPAATDALLGLKYILALDENDLEAEKGYEAMVSTTAQTLYLNPNALGIASLIDGEAAAIELGNNAFLNLNEVWKAMVGGTKDIFTLQEDVDFTLHNLTEGQTITSAALKELSLPSEDEEEAKATISSAFTAERDGAVYRFDTRVPDSANGKEQPTVKYIGKYQAGEQVADTSTATAQYAAPNDFYRYCKGLSYAYADDAVLAEYAQIINSRDISFHVEKNTRLTGSFTAGKNQRILFTIPWDEGWTCFIDGNKVPIDKTWDLFMSVSVPEGQHTYEMRFFPAWMDYGLYLCAGAAAGFTVLLILWRKKQKGSDGQESEHVPAGSSVTEE